MELFSQNDMVSLGFKRIGGGAYYKLLPNRLTLWCDHTGWYTLSDIGGAPEMLDPQPMSLEQAQHAIIKLKHENGFDSANKTEIGYGN